MFVFIPGSIPPVRFGPGGTDPAEISIPAVTYTRRSINPQWNNTSFDAKLKMDCLKKLSQIISFARNMKKLIFFICHTVYQR